MNYWIATVIPTTRNGPFESDESILLMIRSVDKSITWILSGHRADDICPSPLAPPACNQHILPLLEAAAAERPTE